MTEGERIVRAEDSCFDESAIQCGSDDERITIIEAATGLTFPESTELLYSRELVGALEPLNRHNLAILTVDNNESIQIPTNYKEIPPADFSRYGPLPKVLEHFELVQTELTYTDMQQRSDVTIASTKIAGKNLLIVQKSRFD